MRLRKQNTEHCANDCTMREMEDNRCQCLNKSIVTKAEIDRLQNSSYEEEVYCENVIHHTCKNFDDIVGCDGCVVNNFEPK